MPRPLFIICAEDAIIDRYTNSVSFHKVLEGVQFFGTEERADAAAIDSSTAAIRRDLAIKAVATWIGEPEDMGQKYEFQTTINLGPSAVVARGTFIWTTKRQRIFSSLLVECKSLEAGTIVVTNSIRPEKSDAEWLSQSFEFDVHRPEQKQRTSAPSAEGESR